MGLNGINHLLQGYFQCNRRMLIYLEYVTKRCFLINLRLMKFQLGVQFLVGNIHYPIGNVLDQIIQSVLLQPYHIVPDVIKAAKNTAEILLDKTVSILPIRNARYKRCGGRTVKWKIPAKIPKAPA